MALTFDELFKSNHRRPFEQHFAFAFIFLLLPSFASSSDHLASDFKLALRKVQNEEKKAD